MSESTTRPTLKLAVCLFPGLTLLDFAGPVQVFAMLDPENIKAHSGLYPVFPPVQVVTTYFSHNREPVVADAGPRLLPHKTYGEVLENFEQYDIVLVPGGVCRLVEWSAFLTMISLVHFRRYPRFP